jgi:hypothetical protein
MNQKKIINGIISGIFLMVLGFFANMAQNSYGLTLSAWCLRGISFLLMLETFRLHPRKIWLKSLIFFPLLMQVLLHPLCWSFISQRFHAPENPGQLPEPFLVPLMFGPLLIFVLMMVTADKTRKIHIPYLLSFFCLGQAGKFDHMVGSSIIYATGSAVAIGFFVESLAFLFKKNMHDKLIKFTEVTMHLFMSVCLLGMLFKVQHWPWGNKIGFTALGIMPVALGLFYATYRFRRDAFPTLAINQPLKKLVFIVLMVLGFWFIGRISGIAPPLYSNELPPTMEEYDQKANNLTEEGRMFDKKFRKYDEAYSEFLDEIEASTERH